jgi:hypothetical protein
MTSFFLASFHFLLSFWLSSLQEQRLISRKERIILYFIGILSIVFRVYLNLLNPILIAVKLLLRSFYCDYKEVQSYKVNL